jgi:hypothetical protein
MIYLMPIDECPHCRARTPRICSHRCKKQTENGHIDPNLASELQSWIASVVAANSDRGESRILPVERRSTI